MQIFSEALPLFVYVALVALHFVSPVLPRLWESILKYANLFFHLVLYALLMLYSIPLDEAVLLYLFSLLLYLFSFLLWQWIRKKQGSALQEKEDGK